MSALGQKIHNLFTETSGKRVDFEEIWLKDLRQYKGIYDPEVLAQLDKKRSKAYIRETRTKVRTIDARLMDLLFPANGEKNWGIEPTPKPSLPADIEKLIISNVARIIQANGEQRQPSKEEIDIAKKTYALEACNNMSEEINDQLSEIKYRSIIRDTGHSGHLYGTGWLKGPLVDQVYDKHWEMAQGQDGQLTWQLTTKPTNKPYAEFRSIWSCYPDMSVTDISLARFMMERHVMPRHKLIDLSKRNDFFGKVIKQFISDYPDGKCDYLNYENMLYQLRDNDTKPRASLKGSYELIEYWGWIAASDLLEFNAEKYANLSLDVTVDLAVNLWLLNDEVIKLALEPITGLAIPYYPYYFDKDETSIFGEGIASIMRDPARLVNASIRAMIDNAAHCAGPQYEVNVDLLHEGEDPTDIGAFKVWLRTGRDADVAGKEVVRVKTLTSYTPEFMNMYNLFSRLGDEITIIPRYLQGDSKVSGAGRTASGLSMLMGQANVGLSDLVKMFDDNITKPFITAMYYWNMQFNDKPEIKGDMQIVARGSTALMAKEIRAQQIQNFLQMTLNPEDVMWVKRGNLLRRWAESTDIGGNEAVYTQEEYDQKQEQRQAAVQQQLTMQNEQKQGGAGFNQLESVIKQLEQGMQMIANKVSSIEDFIAQSVQNSKRALISGGQR